MPTFLPQDDERETLATLQDAHAFIDAHEQPQQPAILDAELSKVSNQSIQAKR